MDEHSVERFPNMPSVIAPVAALLLSVALLLMGNGLQGTLLPVRAQLEDFGSLSIGILGSFYFAGFALGCLLGPKAVQRVGHIRVFTAMVSFDDDQYLAVAAVGHNGQISLPSDWAGSPPTRPGQPLLVSP